MAELIDEAKTLVRQAPDLLTAIDRDLNQKALGEKALRAADAKYHADQHPNLPEEQHWDCKGDAPHALAKGGRKRTPALIILIALFIRGRYGSLTDMMVRDRIADSASFQLLLDEHGIDTVCPTVLCRHVNNLSDQTITRLMDAQIATYKDEELDDFDIFMADSTSVRANSEWPKDSRVILKLCDRAITILEDFEKKKQWCRVRWYNMKKWQRQIHNLARDIDFTCGKPNGAKNRRKLYRRLLPLADQLVTRLGDEWDRIEPIVNGVPLCPSKASQRWQATELLETTLMNAVNLIPYVYVRTQENPHEKREEHEQILSVADSDAAIICKGGREPNFGYKPQLAASRRGFITAAIVTTGNPSDAQSLLPLLDAHVSRCGLTPSLGTVDDGYSSAENWRLAVEKRGLKALSMNGAKGKAVVDKINPELWTSEVYKEGRRLRGLMESPIAVLKQSSGFDRMRRSGVDAVRREIFEKIIAYNAVRAVQLRKRAAERRARTTATRARLELVEPPLARCG